MGSRGLAPASTGLMALAYRKSTKAIAPGLDRDDGEKDVGHRKVSIQ